MNNGHPNSNQNVRQPQAYFCRNEVSLLGLAMRRLQYAGLFGKENRTHTTTPRISTHIGALGTPGKPGCSLSKRLNRGSSTHDGGLGRTSITRGARPQRPAGYHLEVVSGSTQSHTKYDELDILTHCQQTMPEN